MRYPEPWNLALWALLKSGNLKLRAPQETHPAKLVQRFPIPETIESLRPPT